MKRYCLNCSTSFRTHQACCPNCNKNDYFEEHFFYIIFHEKKYLKKEWYEMTTSFRKFNEKEIELKNQGLSLTLTQIEHIIFWNVKKHTFLGKNLVAALFLLISLISFSLGVFFQYNANFGLDLKNPQLFIYSLFIGILFLILSFILFYFSFVKKEKLIYTKIRGQFGYKRISKKEYFRMIEIFQKKIQENYDLYPNIYTERLLLRRFDLDDVKDVYLFGKNPHVTQYLMWENFQNEEDARQMIQNAIKQYEEGKEYKLAIEEKTTKKVIGYIGLSRYDYSLYTCQVVYALNESYWNQGYMTEALQEFVSYLVKTGKKTIYAGHVKENAPSGKVLLKCGFIRDQNRDTSLVIHGEVKEIYQYIYQIQKEKV